MLAEEVLQATTDPEGEVRLGGSITGAASGSKTDEGKRPYRFVFVGEVEDEIAVILIEIDTNCFFEVTAAAEIADRLGRLPVPHELEAEMLGGIEANRHAVGGATIELDFSDIKVVGVDWDRASPGVAYVG